MTPFEWIVVAVIAVGALASAGTAVYSGEQARKAQSYNADAMEEQARAERMKADYEAGILKRNADKMRARMRLNYLSSGVDISEGTAMMVMAEDAKQAEMDFQAIRYGGNAAAIRAKQEARMARYQGASAARAGYINAGSSLLTGAGQAAQTYASFQSKRIRDENTTL